MKLLRAPRQQRQSRDLKMERQLFFVGWVVVVAAPSGLVLRLGSQVGELSGSWDGGEPEKGRSDNRLLRISMTCVKCVKSTHVSE